MKYTRDNIDSVLTQYFITEWKDRTPVVYKNALIEDIDPKAEAWVRFSVIMTVGQIDSYGSTGNRRFLRIGRAYTQIFVRSGLRTALLNELASEVYNIWETARLSPLRVNQIIQNDLPDGADRKASITGDGAWFGTLINAQFMFDEVK